MSQLKGIARNLNQLTQLTHSKRFTGIVSRYTAIVVGIKSLLKIFAMIGKIMVGSSCAGTVGYVMKKPLRVLDAESVTPPDIQDMCKISKTKRY